MRAEAERWLLAAGFRQWEAGEYTSEQFARSIEREAVLVVRQGTRLVSTVTIARDDGFIWAGWTLADRRTGGTGP
ncbi:hypothetical protein ABN034_01495 [Actinopolymorpha sp. B11F2]|uniref:hypothetical protein n=1 Tax=Actinopolymorpha sp. B11F2 TaxID=3160862 RepID=UPI0032E45656